MRLKSKGLLQLILVLFAGALLGWFGKGLASPDTSAVLPGSEGDPLVSRSYVDSQMKFQVLEVAQGKKVICSSGTELILRSGSATAIDSSLGGLSDVTGGKDLRSGDSVPKNHLLIVPRDDGRGILATSASVVMVRGSYEIK